MTDYSVDAPATITITHPGGSDTITVTVPAAPVTPPGRNLSASSRYSVARRRHWRLDRPQRQCAARHQHRRHDRYGGAPIPGSGLATPWATTRRATGRTSRRPPPRPWLYWGGSMTDATDWHTPAHALDAACEAG